MEYETATSLTHCPKCGQVFPDDGQRFCDIDGARLVTDAGAGRGAQNVFSSVLPKGVPDDTLDERFDREPRFVIPESEERQIDQRMSEMFDEGEPEMVFEVVDEPEDERIFGRRVDPYEIPPSHVEVIDIGLGAHPSINRRMLDTDDPEGFVGAIVKGRYEATEFVSQDESGYTYIADDRIVDGRKVLIRILAFGDHDDVTAGILAEERVSLSHLDHPNVEKLFDSGELGDGRVFLISEHLDALTVADILQIHGPLDAKRVARIIRQVGNAVSDVHNEGALHRDLRPEYLVLASTDGGTEIAKVANYGVSDGTVYSDNLAYTAPELIDGQIGTIASDQYALGVIAYQMLTGKMPFEGETARELRAATRRQPSLLPTDLRRDISPSVDRVIIRALSENPIARYSTAREFGDALSAALLEAAPANVEKPSLPKVSLPSAKDPVVKEVKKVSAAERVNADQADTRSSGDADVFAWTRRSPEPPAEHSNRWFKIAGIGIAVLALVAIGIWLYVLSLPPSVDLPTGQQTAGIPGDVSTDSNATDIEVPPLERSIPQPPNTSYFQNSRQDLKGDLIRNFVAFSLYYPKDWKFNGPQPSGNSDSRGKFLDISRTTPGGKLKEQMLISYYPSKGTFKEDSAKFPELVKEANETLKDLIPNYQLVSEGNTVVNGGWNAYEIKFQGSGIGDNGDRILLWGRRLFMPAARPGVRAGFEITMLATSYAEDVRSVDGVGVRGELAQILYTFEPGQNF